MQAADVQRHWPATSTQAMAGRGGTWSPDTQHCAVLLRAQPRVFALEMPFCFIKSGLKVHQHNCLSNRGYDLRREAGEALQKSSRSDFRWQKVSWKRQQPVYPSLHPSVSIKPQVSAPRNKSVNPLSARQ